MASQIKKGIELLDDRAGDGPVAVKGAVVTYNARFFLRRGDEVRPDALSIATYGSRLNTRIIDGVEVVDHVTTLGRRQSIAGVENSLYGMQSGGYREVRVSPHLAYGENGIKDLIPPNALLRIQLWVNDVQNGH